MYFFFVVFLILEIMFCNNVWFIEYIVCDSDSFYAVEVTKGGELHANFPIQDVSVLSKTEMSHFPNFTISMKMINILFMQDQSIQFNIQTEFLLWWMECSRQQ